MYMSSTVVWLVYSAPLTAGQGLVIRAVCVAVCRRSKRESLRNSNAPVVSFFGGTVQGSRFPWGGEGGSVGEKERNGNL